MGRAVAQPDLQLPGEDYDELRGAERGASRGTGPPGSRERRSGWPRGRASSPERERDRCDRCASGRRCQCRAGTCPCLPPVLDVGSLEPGQDQRASRAGDRASRGLSRSERGRGPGRGELRPRHASVAWPGPGRRSGRIRGRSNLAHGPAPARRGQPMRTLRLPSGARGRRSSSTHRHDGAHHHPPSSPGGIPPPGSRGHGLRSSRGRGRGHAGQRSWAGRSHVTWTPRRGIAISGKRGWSRSARGSSGASTTSCRGTTLPPPARRRTGHTRGKRTRTRSARHPASSAIRMEPTRHRDANRKTWTSGPPSRRALPPGCRTTAARSGGRSPRLTHPDQGRAARIVMIGAGGCPPASERQHLRRSARRDLEAKARSTRSPERLSARGRGAGTSRRLVREESRRGRPFFDPRTEHAESTRFHPSSFRRPRRSGAGRTRKAVKPVAEIAWTIGPEAPRPEERT